MNELFLNRIKETLPPKALECFGKKSDFVYFRINGLKTTISEAKNSLQSLGVSFEEIDWYPWVLAVAFLEAQKVFSSSLVSKGHLYAQGLESMKAVIELDPQPGEHVLDLCAAPGSKTSQIAAHMKNEGLLIANEPVRARFYRLKSVLEITGAKATLKMIDGRRYRILEDFFDRVLVDAPCSSEGRFKFDDPKSYAYWSPRKIKEMAHKQKGLLLNASRLLKSGGTLVYSTCTFSNEENEEVVEWFQRKSEGMELQTQQRILPDGRMEGFFIAKWRKV